jgi:hypothetical protein
MTPNNKRSAVIRRARQNKRSGMEVGSKKPFTKVWNIASQPYPASINSMNGDNVVHNVRQWADLGPFITSSAGGEVDGSQSFQVSLIPGITSWLSVFDQYRIALIEVWATLQCSSGQAIIDGFRWGNVVDYDDANNVSFAAMQQYSNMTDSGRNECVYRRFVPHQSMVVGTVGGNQPSGNIVAGWNDSSRTDVNHFGMKYALQATSTTVVLSQRVRFHLQFRNNI